MASKSSCHNFLANWQQFKKLLSENLPMSIIHFGTKLPIYLDFQALIHIEFEKPEKKMLRLYKVFCFFRQIAACLEKYPHCIFSTLFRVSSTIILSLRTCNSYQKFLKTSSSNALRIFTDYDFYTLKKAIPPLNWRDFFSISYLQK
jgi:hypothetical protein